MGTTTKKIPYAVYITLVVWIFGAGAAYLAFTNAGETASEAHDMSTKNKEHIAVLRNTQEMNMAEQARRFNAIDKGIANLGTKIDSMK